MDLYKRDWVVVDHLDAKFRQPPQLPPHVDLPKLHVEVDSDLPADVKSLPPLSGGASLLQPVKALEEEAENARKARHQGRPALLNVYHMMSEEFHGVDNRVRSPPTEEHSGSKLMFELQELHMQFHTPEPLFCTVSMWNVQTGEKLSEDFVCHLNVDLVLEKLGLKGPYSASTMARKALFSAPQRTHDIVLVVLITKTLRGETLDHMLEPFLKGESLMASSMKMMQKLRQDIEYSMQHLGQYTQPLAFAVVPLFHPDGSLLPSATGAIQMYAYPKNGFDKDFVVQKLSSLVLQDAKGTKMRAIPGLFQVSVKEVSDTSQIEGRISSFGLDLKPENPSRKLADAVLEVHPFFNDAVHVFPLYEFVNMLFVQPLSLNFSKFSGHNVKGRNLVLEVSLKDDDNDPLVPGLPLFFGRMAEQDHVGSVRTIVNYHEKRPLFMEEFKTRLPVALKPSHHLLFLISHIDCKTSGNTKKSASGKIRTPVGFAFLPLLINDGRFMLSDGLHDLPVSSTFPSKYLSPETDNEDLLKWVDKRPLLQVVTRAQSSLFPSDPHLRAFMHAITQATVTEASLADLARCSDAALVQNCPVVLDLLFQTIAHHGPVAAKAALRVLLDILQRVSNAQSAGQARNPLFDSYLGYVLTLDQRASTDSILNLVIGVTAILNDKATVELACQFGWVFCDTIIKWLFLLARKEGTLEDDLHRSKRFQPTVYEAIETLLKSFLRQLHILSDEMIGLAKELGMTVAFFLMDLLSITDRGFAMKLIGYYMDHVVLQEGPMSQKQLLESCKMDALSVICSHEHFVGLNLPPTSRPKQKQNLADLAKRHFLVNVLVRSVLDQQRSPDKAVRLLAMSALRNQLVKHDLDPRYQKTALKQRIAAMYFQFVWLFVKEREHFWDQYNLEEKRTALFCVLYVLAHTPSHMISKWWASETLTTKTNFFRCLCRLVLTFEYQGRSHVATMVRDFTSMKLSRVKQLTSIRTHGHANDGTVRGPASVKNTYRPAAVSPIQLPEPSPRGGTTTTATTEDSSPLDASGVRAWKKQATLSPRTGAAALEGQPSPRGSPSSATPTTTTTEDTNLRSWRKQVQQSPRSGSSLNLVPASPESPAQPRTPSTTSSPLDDSAGLSKTRAWKSKVGTPVSIPSLSPLPGTSAGNGGGTQPASTLRSEDFKMNTSVAALLPTGVTAAASDDPEHLYMCLQEMHLSREAVLTVLDVTMLYVEQFRNSLSKKDSATFSLIMEVFVHILHVYHTTETFSHIAQALRIVICGFRDSLFAFSTGHAQQLTFRILTLFNSECGAVRRDAAALFYLMMRENFLVRGNCQRMKLAATVGINRLSEPNLKLKLSEEYFLNALEAVGQYAQDDRACGALPANFLAAVKESQTLLQTILRNMIRIRTFSYDPERLADLYQELCDGYRNSPDLRATWLQTLASFHESRKDYEEAAQCRIHLSALISTYLGILKPTESVPVDKLAFTQTAPNIEPEFVTPADLALDEGICSSDIFTRTGLFQQLEESVSLLKKDSLFESCIAVERLMGNIQQRNHDWSALSNRFTEMSDLCHMITKAEEEHNRIFAKWYRVNFWGDVFGDLNGTRWVYKERPEVMMPTFIERMTTQYANVFGQDKVRILSNTESINNIQMEPGMAYLQLAPINPYLDIDEVAGRFSDFERQTNICKFVMETPFTKSGKPHGNWDEQCMRRTIMTVKRVFPFITKRLAVLNETSTVLEPIENAIYGIQERVEQLRKQNESLKPNIKSVQQFLQGSVLLQVNPGPLAICEVFLAPAHISKYSKFHVSVLQKAMSSLIFEARALLLLNATLIDASQLNYQIALTEGYNDMRKKLSVFIGEERLADEVDAPEMPEAGNETVR